MNRILNAYAFIMVTLSVGDAAKILLAPWPYYSHVDQFLTIGETLLEQGHEVKIMVSASFPQTPTFKDKVSSIQLLEYRVQYADMYTFPQPKGIPIENLIGLPELIGFRILITGMDSFCYNALDDLDFSRKIQEEQFDLAIVDAFPSTRCYYILFYRLGVPYVSHTTNHEPWLYRNPALPSFVPFGMSYPAKSQEMSFTERLWNLIHAVDWAAFPRIPYLDDSLVAKYAPEKPFVTLDWLAGRSLVWLIATDVALDYPRPMMPNEINIGGLTTRPAESLSGEVLQLVNQAPDGVIVVSFGSFDVLSAELYLKLFQTFFNVPKTVQVFMRYTREIPSDISMPPNLKLMKWLPQNDLLGHQKTKLFITHGGANSQFEALYHVVPMIMFPLYGDQPYNAKRADYKGHAIVMDILQFTPTELVHNMNLLLNDNSIKANIQKDSNIFRSRVLTPRQRAVYWIEHVLEFGGAHLRSHALDMPWYEYLMLDVAALFALFFSAVAVLLYFIIICMCSVCCQPKTKLKKQ